MITDNEKFKKEVKEIVDNRVVSWAFLNWLNEQEQKVKAFFIDLLIAFLIGRENRFIMSVYYMVFRKQIKEILASGVKITKEMILKLRDEIKEYKESHKNSK